MTRLARFAVALLALAGAQFAAVTAAHATGTGPWPNGTVFVAVAQLRTGFGGGVYAVLPDNGGSEWLGSGSVNDVAVSPSGTVYWGTCNGDVYSDAGSGSTYLRSVGGCVGSIAVEPDGSLLIDSSAGLKNCPATAAGSCTTLPYELQASGMVIDPDGDIYAMSGGGQLEVVLAGTNDPVGVSGLFDGAGTSDSLRFGPGGNLLTAVPFGSKIVLQSLNSLATTTYSVGGDYVAGAVEDTSGNVFASDAKDDPSTQDQIDEFPVGTTTNPLVYQTGFDTPRGLSTYPVLGPPARTGSSVTLQAAPASPVTTLQAVTLTATVDGGSATDGLVQFASDGSPLGDAVPVSGGTASTTTTLPAGNADSITATYLGSSTEDPSQSDALPYEVDTIDTTTTLTTTNYHRVHQNRTVHVTATVDSGGNGTPTGYVDFNINKNEVDSEPLDSNGSASASLAVPVHKFAVTATYETDGTYGASTSNALWFTPIPPFTPNVNTDVHYGASSPNGHQNIRLDVRVTGVKGQPVPTGTISTDDNRFTCTALTQHASSATGSCVAHALPPAGYDVTVTYSGDSVYATANDFASFYVGG